MNLRSPILATVAALGLIGVAAGSEAGSGAGEAGSGSGVGSGMSGSGTGSSSGDTTGPSDNAQGLPALFDSIAEPMCIDGTYPLYKTPAGAVAASPDGARRARAPSRQRPLTSGRPARR